MFRHVAKFNDAVQKSAQDWSTSRTVTRRPDEEAVRYAKAGDLLVVDVLKDNTNWYYDVKEAPPVFGVRVMFRTCYIAAMLAREEGISIDELSTALGGRRTYSLLNRLMTKTPVVAEEVEKSIGLFHTYEPLGVEDLKGWRIDEDGIGFEDLSEVIDQAKQAIGVEKDGRCPIYRLNLQKKIFPAIIDICERDESLFQRSLQETNQTAHARESVLPLL